MRRLFYILFLVGGFPIMTKDAHAMPVTEDAAVSPALPETEIKIPDDNFKLFLVEHFDYDGDGEISAPEANAVTRMNVSTENIASIEGIEHFTALEELVCSPANPFAKGMLTSFDISRNKLLRKLKCDNNLLDTLDISRNTALTELNCRNNNIKSLDVSRNTLLE
ncbi:MAG: hypothetical protein LBT42_00315, partial [Tannerella sp.]|nr:hypothetical protein [Tannerella sp.]